MRGEYKVPGGKLVAVDLGVSDGRLSDVSISGDFFLEPDEALADLNAALTGLSTEVGVDHLASAVDAAIDETVSLIGFTPEAIGIAVRRALGTASGWADHAFDLVPPITLDPAMHVALDEVIAHEVAASTRPPTLRFWDWDRPLVVLGSFQSMRNEVDPDDIASDRGKIGGAAQKRFASGAVLHHVTMAYDIDADKMLEVLRIGREKLSDKGTTSANKRVDPMRSQTGMTREAIIDSFTDSFARGHRTTPATYSGAELDQARQLVAAKFAAPEWTHRVP